MQSNAALKCICSHPRQASNRHLKWLKMIVQRVWNWSNEPKNLSRRFLPSGRHQTSALGRWTDYTLTKLPIMEEQCSDLRSLLTRNNSSHGGLNADTRSEMRLPFPGATAQPVRSQARSIGFLSTFPRWPALAVLPKSNIALI